MKISKAAKVTIEACVIAAIVGILMISFGDRGNWNPTDIAAIVPNDVKLLHKRIQSIPLVSSSDVTSLVPLCGMLNASRGLGSPPFVVGSVSGATTQALVIDTTCKVTVSGVNYAAYTVGSGVSVNTGSYLSFNKVSSAPNLFLIDGSLNMIPGSYFDAVFASTVTNSSSFTAVVLQHSSSICIDPTDTSFSTFTGCPSGSICSFVAGGTSGKCTISISVSPASSISAFFWTVELNQDCNVYSQSSFLSTVSSTLQVDPSLMVMQPQYCGSTFESFQCKGTSVIEASALCSFIYARATLPGSLNTQLKTLNGWAATASPFKRSSGSNKALLGLLALLVIPVAIIIGVVAFCIMKPKKEHGDGAAGGMAGDGGKDPFPNVPAAGAPTPTPTPFPSAPHTTAGTPLVDLQGGNVHMRGALNNEAAMHAC